MTSGSAAATAQTRRRRQVGAGDEPRQRHADRHGGGGDGGHEQDGAAEQLQRALAPEDVPGVRPAPGRPDHEVHERQADDRRDGGRQHAERHWRAASPGGAIGDAGISW